MAPSTLYLYHDLDGLFNLSRSQFHHLFKEANNSSYIVEGLP